MHQSFLRALVVAIAGLMLALPAVGEPFRPGQDSQVLERLPTGLSQDPQLRDLRQLRDRLTQDPDNLELALEIARSYISLARAEGDPRYQGYAQAALAPWWQEPQAPAEVLMLRATIRQNGHDFEAALQDLERLLRARPHDSQAWLTRAVILQVQGRFAEAYESCWPLQRSNRLLATACLAGAAGSSGHAASSYDMLQRALAKSPHAAYEDQLWALTSLADLALRLGRHEAAEAHFEAALALEVRDIYLLSAYADFLLDRDRPQEVLDLLADEVRSDALLLRLTLAESRLGSAMLGQHVTLLADRFAQSRRRGDTLHLGAESRFLLHLRGAPAEALQLARQNWRLQREPVDARRVLEAALAARDRAGAQTVIAWLDETRLEDVRLAELAHQIQELS
ncbi:MAG: hypothetical protein AAF560_24940 [Acidobacteriota bacterium]